MNDYKDAYEGTGFEYGKASFTKPSTGVYVQRVIPPKPCKCGGPVAIPYDAVAVGDGSYCTHNVYGFYQLHVAGCKKSKAHEE